MGIISRSDAIAAGLDRYFTGKACKHGHTVQRSVNGRHCIECARARGKTPHNRKLAGESRRRRRLENPEKARAKDRAAMAKQRRRRGQVLMVEYRAGVHAEAEARRAAKAAEAAARKEARRIENEKLRTAAKERRRQQNKAWREANPERHRELIRAWKAANRDKVNGRKIRKRKAIIAALFPKQRGRCAYCRDKLVEDRLHIDHIMPKALGGSNARSNLQLTCDTCNMSKKAVHPIEFAQSIGRLI
jgi:5-methylcytosine-specific restriction endonuclease McrA